MLQVLIPQRYASIIIFLVLVVLYRTDGITAAINCHITPDTACFDPESNSFVTVGNNVESLDGTLKICLGEISASPSFTSLRIILIIDRSTSMCRNALVDPGMNCCTWGDSSGNCMMNDPNDMRIIAAHRFVDTLAQRDSMSEVGIIGFDQATTINNPIALNSDINILKVHQWIDAASCAALDILPYTGIPATPTLRKTTGAKRTCIGLSLEAGLQAVDYNFSSLPASTLRHIIILTDGAWDDPEENLSNPDTILNRYRMQVPVRRVPIIHGIFISNTELHVAHGYPPEGCSNTEKIELEKLELVTKLTGGLYFAGTTPSTIVDNFSSIDELLKLPAPPQPHMSISLTNVIKSMPLNSTILQVGNSNVLLASLPNIPLENGLNTLTLKRAFSISGKPDSTTITTYTIFRDILLSDVPANGLFRVFCTSTVPEKFTGIYRYSPDTPPNTPHASLNLLGRKGCAANLGENKICAGVYLSNSDRSKKHRRNLTVK